MSTGLTPSVSRISLTQIDATSLQSLALRMLESNHPHSALHYAQQLHKLSKSTADGILCARCHYLADEKRRCLGVLEHLGYLGADAVQAIREGSPEGQDFLTAIALAAQCLLDLEQFDDCIELVDPLMGVDRFKAGQVFASDGARKFASLYFTLGKCYDSTDNRNKAIRFLVKAVQTDPFLIEAAEYLMSRSLLTPKQKTSLLQELEVEFQQETSLLEHYKYNSYD